MQCESGHLTCEECDKENESCPVCRQPHASYKRIRNRIAEQVGHINHPGGAKRAKKYLS